MALERACRRQRRFTRSDWRRARPDRGQRLVNSILHQGNRGHGGALLTAREAALGDHLFLIDSDCQILLADFSAAWSQITPGRDAVFGVRRRRQDPALASTFRA
ncbi:MAG: glycosyltransferase [Vicinamibacterales bacterium]